MKGGLSKRLPTLSRDTLLFILGSLGFAHETLVEKADRPNFLLACLAMVGLPAFLQKRNEKDDKDED